MRKNINAALIAAFFILGIFIFIKGFKTDKIQPKEEATSAESSAKGGSPTSFSSQFFSDEEQSHLSSITSNSFTDLEKEVYEGGHFEGKEKEVLFYKHQQNSIEQEKWSSVQLSSDSLFMYSSHWSSKDEAKANALMGLAKSGYEKVASAEPENIHSLGQLALIYIYHDQMIMPGVGKLKQIIALDSNNEMALYQLGMLSIQSGQYNKAVQRFKKLISLQPSNQEYQKQLSDIQELMKK